jgi:DNA-binding PadR family transcriptional regulator
MSTRRSATIEESLMAARDTRKPEDRIPLTPASYGILLALGEGEAHGYGIMQRLTERTGGRERILPGTLYASLARMVADGLVEEREPPAGDASGGPARRYYRRTSFGRAVARAESERVRALLEMAVAQRIVPGVTG